MKGNRDSVRHYCCDITTNSNYVFEDNTFFGINFQNHLNMMLEKVGGKNFIYSTSPTQFKLLKISHDLVKNVNHLG